MDAAPEMGMAPVEGASAVAATPADAAPVEDWAASAAPPQVEGAGDWKTSAPTDDWGATAPGGQW